MSRFSQIGAFFVKNLDTDIHFCKELFKLCSVEGIMNRRLLYILGLCCVFTAFWACGDGELISADELDEFAVEKISKMSKAELDSIMDLCRDDSKCRAEMEKYPSPALSSSEAESTTSSSEGNPESASGNTSSSLVIITSSAQSSEDPADSSSSSSAAPSSSSAESSASPTVSSSSETSPESSSTEKSSSSEESSSSSAESSSEESSSSEMDPESSEPEPASSSSEEESSSSQESSSSLLPPKGTCYVKLLNGSSTSSVKKGEPVELTYDPDEGTSTAGKMRWIVRNVEIADGGSLSSRSVKLSFTEASDFSIQFTIDNKQVCTIPMTVIDEDYVDPGTPASSNDDTPETSATSSTPSPTSGGGSPGITSGGSTTNSSSSVSVRLVNDFAATTEYQPGSYRVADNYQSRACNVQFIDHSNKIDDVFTYPQTEDGPVWDDGYGRTITARPRMEFSFTTGTLTVSCF